MGFVCVKLIDFRFYLDSIHFFILPNIRCFPTSLTHAPQYPQPRYWQPGLAILNEELVEPEVKVNDDFLNSEGKPKKSWKSRKMEGKGGNEGVPVKRSEGGTEPPKNHHW